MNTQHIHIVSVPLTILFTIFATHSAIIGNYAALTGWAVAAGWMLWHYYKTAVQELDVTKYLEIKEPTNQQRGE